MEKNNMTLDEIWEQEELQGLERRLLGEYPAWKRRRRTRRALVASVSALLVAGISIFNFQFSTPKDYDYVCCNRSTFPDNHWAEVAGNILLTN